jgi:hypothetical protein
MFATSERNARRSVVMAITTFARSLLWVPRAWGRSPIIRRSDRLEALAILAGLAIALAAFPVATQTAHDVHDVGVHAARQQADTRHPVEAVALDDGVGLSAGIDGASFARVEWYEGSERRIERAVVPAITQAGQTVRIWRDDTGDIVDAPATAEDARMTAAMLAVGMWIAIGAASALGVCAVRRGLNRARYSAWDRGLYSLIDNGGGRANRHV